MPSRRLGNTVRHLQGRVTADDARLALEFVERMLKWFFCHFRDGRQLSAITDDGGPIWQDAYPELHAVMELFDDPKFDPLDGARQMEDKRTSVLLSSPALPAVLADMLLDRDECAAARTVLERAHALFPSDVRLQQLMGLFHSRTGDLKEALKYLEPLYEKLTDDDETAGILGGIYKRCWQHEGTKTDWLAKSYRAYRRGWERSKCSNAYPGINAATTALWLGRPSESREIAAKVGELLRGRAKAVHAKPGLVFDYWDQVSLAEAELLAGNLAEARDLYRDAFERHALRRGDLKVSQNQLSRDPSVPRPFGQSGRVPGSRIDGAVTSLNAHQHIEAECARSPAGSGKRRPTPARRNAWRGRLPGFGSICAKETGAYTAACC